MNNLVSFMKLDEPLGPVNPASSRGAPISERPGLHCLAHGLKLHGGMWGPGDELPIKF